ncbi:hypothetical protein, partial [uncultured Prevotella sp.]|uniref:hypothetical protein n=1 Tax=uncultured Prevotella sp. TaxID=159272 RepID=UPI0025936499
SKDNARREQNEINVFISYPEPQLILWFVLNWARCLPNWGNVLAHHGQRACPCWADLLSDGCPIS